MALIKCAECNKDISNLAKACPNCGCTVKEMKVGGSVRIKLPNIELGSDESSSSRKVKVEACNGRILWEGEYGKTAVFRIREPINVDIIFGKHTNIFGCRIEPRKKYDCVEDRGECGKTAYYLSEADIVDAD